MIDATLPPFAPGIFTEENGQVVLLGGQCETCGSWSFPCVDRCPEDGGAVLTRSLGSSGKLYSHTSIHVRPPFGLPTPYGLGAVDLDAAPLRVAMLLDPARLSAMSIGVALTLRAAAMGVNLAGEPCVRPYFTPAEGEQA